MNKSSMLKVRVEPGHEAKVSELTRATGMNTSQIVRALIENAKLEMRPMIGATLTMAKNANSDV